MTKVDREFIVTTDEYPLPWEAGERWEQAHDGGWIISAKGLVFYDDEFDYVNGPSSKDCADIVAAVNEKRPDLVYIALKDNRVSASLISKAGSQQE